MIYGMVEYTENTFLKIYNPIREALFHRTETFYKPYHAALDKLVHSALEDFGKCTVLDLHSFMVPIGCNICLGDINGKACAPLVMECLIKSFAQQGFRAKKNIVFKGGFITSKYLHINNVDSVQIDLSYTQYLEPEHYELTRPSKLINTADKHHKFINTKERLRKAILSTGLL
jgi:N-formylglutamate amidohydrolase